MTVEVSFRFLDSGWKHETRQLSEEELDALLKDAKLVSCDTSGWSSAKSLMGVTLKLKDGRKCVLSEENTPSYEGSSEGWINIYIDEEW